MTLTAGLIVLAPWGACALSWRRGRFGLALASAVLSTQALAPSSPGEEFNIYNREYLRRPS